MTKKFKFRVCVFICASLAIVQAGPIDRYLRIVREVYPEIEPEKADGSQKQVCIVGDVVYTADEAVPAEQPCLKCKCQPPGVHCETTRCQKKPGCRAIHKPNECCPEYQCECEFEGKVYANGERLETKPGGECQVCYCRGGEVQCTEVSCYIRTDCEGRRVPGQCCPKYEHCPPIEPIQEKVKSEGFISSATTQISSEFTGNISSENEISDTTDVLQKLKTTPLVTLVTPPPEFPEGAKPNPGNEQQEEPKITIHEIIPELKEIPITEGAKVESSTQLQGQLLVEEKVINTENLVDTSAIVSHHDSKIAESELSEIFEHPPPIIKVGDKILYLQKDEIGVENITPTPLIVSNSPDPSALIRTEKPEAHVIKKEIKESEQNTAIIIQEIPKASMPTTETNVDNSTIDVAVELPAAETADIETDCLDNEQVRLESTAATIKIEEVAIKTEKPKVDDVVLENPAYPPIPEIMVQQDAEYEHPEIVEIHEEIEVVPSSTEISKILPEILEIRNNNSIPENSTNISWLKAQALINEKAILPDVIVKQIAISDLDQTTNTNLLTTVNNPDISASTEEIKQISTPFSVVNFQSDDLLKHAVMENEPVIENHVKKIVDDQDITGTLSMVMKEDLKQKSTESVERTSSESGENTTPKGVQTVSAMVNDNASIENVSDSNEQKLIKKNPDVEIINPELLAINSTDFLTNLTHQENKKPSSEAQLISTKIEKRTVPTEQSESDKIFQELDTELKLLSGDYTPPDHTDKSKDDAIFKELLDEIYTNKKIEKKTSNDPIQRATDKLANFKFKDARQSLDIGVIGAVRDLFTAQYRSYAKK